MRDARAAARERAGPRRLRTTSRASAVDASRPVRAPKRGRAMLKHVLRWRSLPGQEERPCRTSASGSSPRRSPRASPSIEPDGRETSAGALLARARTSSSTRLRARGLRRGDTIAAVLGNEVAMLELFLAAWQAGLYLTPINGHLAAAGDRLHRRATARPRSSSAASAPPRPRARAADRAGLPGEARASRPAQRAGLRSLRLAQGAASPTTLPERSHGRRHDDLHLGHDRQAQGRAPAARCPPSPEVVGEANAMFLMLFGITPREGVHLVVSPLYHTAVLNFCTNHLHFGHTRRAHGQVDAGGHAGAHRALPGDQHPHGADAVPPPPRPARGGEAAAPTSPPCATSSTAPRPARSTSSGRCSPGGAT